jgi:hypothetical protein
LNKNSAPSTYKSQPQAQSTLFVIRTFNPALRVAPRSVSSIQNTLQRPVLKSNGSTPFLRTLVPQMALPFTLQSLATLLITFSQAVMANAVDHPVGLSLRHYHLQQFPSNPREEGIPNTRT